jgi:hypothetical protein
MAPLLLAALLNVSDAPLVEAPPPAGRVALSESLREPEESLGVRNLMGWGYSLSTLGVAGLLVAGITYGLLLGSSAACRASPGCIDEAGLLYLYAAIPLLFGFTHASVGFPLLGKGLHLRRLAELRAAEPAPAD